MKQYFHIFIILIRDRQAFKTGNIEFVPLNVHGDVNALKADGLSPAILTMSIIVGVAFALYVVRVSCKYIQKKKKKMNVRKVSFFLLLNLCKLHSRWRGTRWVCRG